MVLSISSGNLAQAAPGAAPAAAVLPLLPGSTQFDVTGFLQDATVSCALYPSLSGNPALCGGTMTLNGHLIIVPAETVVILPASALTWAELFSLAPAPYGGIDTGMALADAPDPLTTYEFQAVGNRVGNTYIAGLVHASQQDLNAGAGYINFMDYATGEMRVGGVLNDPTTGARVRINDPASPSSANGGRYGRAMTPDGRFMVDQDNPTIASAQGFPMCFPRTDPAVVDDPLCPQANRPISTGIKDPVTLQQHPPAGEFDSFFTMDTPTNVDTNPLLCVNELGVVRPCADPRKQAPMEVGDYVNYAGTLVSDDPNHPTGGPYPGTANTFISAHTINNNTAIFTAPGTDPAYITIEVALIGTGGLTVFGAGEAAIRTRFEGMTTDPSRNIHLYGIDINPTTGATSDRDWGTIGVDPGPPVLGAVKGRWRFRPPCAVFGTPVTDKKCTMNQAGTFLPPTREVRAVIEGLQTQVPGSGTEIASANGIFYGQYHAPIGEYIFPENVPGQPIPENNFNTIDFLAFGGYSSFTGVIAGVLNPWPSNVPPPARVCAVPNTGGPYAVANGGTINLSGSVNAGATSPVLLSWTAGLAPSTTNLNGALTNPTTTTPIFSAVGLAPTVGLDGILGTADDNNYNLTFTASNVCGAASAATTIVVQPAPPPTINPILDQTVNVNTLVTINASSASLPAPTWTWVQVVNGAPIVALTQTPSAATPSGTSRVTFTPVVAGPPHYLFDVTATNVNGTSSPATRVTITVNAASTLNITIGTAEYRTGQQRLVIAATTTDLTVTSMVLQPYLTENGTMTTGTTPLTNGGGGLWNLTIVGAQRPACKLGGTYATPCTQFPLVVTSTGGVTPGTSAPTRLTRIRQ
jgi:hypothetical protein